jgi:hypothetical protein
MAAPADVAALRRGLAQQHAQQGRLAGARRADQAQGLARFQAQRHVVEGGALALAPLAVGARRILAVVGEAHLVQYQRAALQLVERAVIVDRQRDLQQRLQARQRRASALDQRQHPAGREHRPDQLAQVHAEAGQRADGDLALPHQPAAQAERQAGGGGEGEADRRLVGGFPFLRTQAGVGGARGQLRELLRAALLPGRGRAGCARRSGFPGRGR